MKISDFKGLFKKNVLEVIEVDNPYDDYYTVKLTVPVSMKWTAGEHGIFKLPNQNIKGKKWRAFSLASTPDEGFVLIGMRMGNNPSSFKNTLINLKKGNFVSIQGPFGWFKLPRKLTPVVMIAGGVGITPIRALLSSIHDRNQNVELIYTSNDFYLFDNDIASFSEKMNIKIDKTENREDTVKLVKSAASRLKNEALYFISGSPNFIKSVSDDLTHSGVKGNRIINDPFMGY